MKVYWRGGFYGHAGSVSSGLVYIEGRQTDWWTHARLSYTASREGNAASEFKHVSPTAKLMKVSGVPPEKTIGTQPLPCRKIWGSIDETHRLSDLKQFLIER